MAPLGRSLCALILLALNAAAEPQISSPAARAFLTHKAGEPLLAVPSAAEVQRGCALPCLDPQSIAVYRAEIGVAGKELGLSSEEIKAAEQNYIPNGVPRKRAASDAATPTSRKLEAQALARMLSDPHVSPAAKQKLAARMESIARALGGLELVDNAGVSVVIGSNPNAANAPNGKLLPRVQLPVGFKAFSPEPPMLSISDSKAWYDNISAAVGLMRPPPKDKLIPLNILQRVPDGCNLLGELSGGTKGPEDCAGDQFILSNGEGQVNIVQRPLPPGTNGEKRALVLRAPFFDRIIAQRTDLNINDDPSFHGTEAEAFTVYHELRHIQTHRDIAALFGGHYPPEAAMTDELVTNDAEEAQYIKQHPDILTMDPPKSDSDINLWAKSRVLAGTVDYRNYPDSMLAREKLQRICESAPEGKPCGGTETMHTYIRMLYAHSPYPTPKDSVVISKLDAFLRSQDMQQQAEFAPILEMARKACEDNWTDDCKRLK